MKSFVILLLLFLWYRQSNPQSSSVVYYDVLTAHPAGFNIEVYLDSADALSSTASHPVLIFLPGFAVTVPSSIYSQLLIKVVQETGNGLIILALSQFQSTNPNVIAENLDTFFTFLSNPNCVQQLFGSNYPNVTLDVENRLGVFGCESGLQSIYVYLNEKCGPVKLLATLDPTDGLYSLYAGETTQSALAQGHFAFHMPTLIIASGLASSSYALAEQITGSCSPSDLSSGLFYNLSAATTNSPVFFVNFTEYGLGDVLNQPVIEAVKTFVCDACSLHPGYPCNYTQHQDDTAQLVARFVNGIFNSNPADLQVIENAQQSFQNVTNKYELNGYNPATQTGFCTHD